MTNLKTHSRLFSLNDHPFSDTLSRKLGIEKGEFVLRSFPDAETYLKISSPVVGLNCLVLADLSQPNAKYLPLIFLLETLRELGAKSVGLILPYLPYMRQDKRFTQGEAITSRVFARALSHHADWLVTIDPHLHRFHSLQEIYQIPSQTVQGAPALANWLEDQAKLLLVGPDEESEQWVSEISRQCGHPFVIGRKRRLGDHEVVITLPDLSAHKTRTAVIIDDVISTGQTILQCVKALHRQAIHRVSCAAVHGLFVEDSYAQLQAAGLQQLVTSNTIPHPSNAFDVSDLLVTPIAQLLDQI